MNLLKEGIEKGFVIKTDRATKLTVDGITDTYPIYQVRLDLLYFNDRNDRIATWISQYMAENGASSFDRSDLEKYNDIIQDFITQSNPDKIKATQNNIEFIGQQKHGVVLNDGRIIDGNRRFTCLRNLSKKDPRYNYFETVILERDFENNAKQIKMLELQIQIGEESRVDYNPIDRLVGIYHDIIENQLLSVKDYAQSTNQTEAEVERMKDLAILLVEFLEAINAPGQYYIARDMDLNGPLVELQGILKNIKDAERREEVKYAVFTNFLMQPSGDMTRFVRELKQVVKEKETKYLDEFVEKEMVITEKVLDQLPAPGMVTRETINVLRADKRTQEELRQTMEITTNKVKAKQTRNKPAQILLKAGDSLETIDTNIFKKLEEEQLAEISEQLDRIMDLVDSIRGALDV